MKKGIQFLILLVAVILVTGCSMPVIGKPLYSEDLAAIFPKEKGTSATYFGLAEYGHKVTIKSIKRTKKILTYNIEGYFDDARGGDSDQRKFEITYTIDKDSVKEEIVNNDKFRVKGQDHTLNSIIPNQIILKLPLKVGTSWKQTFSYNDQEYKATTKITQVINAKKGNKQYTTKTVVNDIEGFVKNQYYEIRTYEVGSGLIQFTNTMKESNINLGREVTQEDFLFGYSQGKVTKPD